MSVELDTPRIQRVQARLGKLLDRQHALPLYGIQYRLGEVSQARIEPRLLRRVLAELSNNRRPRRGRLDPGPWNLCLNGYASAELTRDRASLLSSRLIDTGRKLAQLNWVASIHELKELVERVSDGECRNEATYTDRRFIVDDATWIASGMTFQVSRSNARQAVAVWCSHDLDWIYPDDWRLWHFLAECAKERLPPVIIARKIAVPTFALLKRLRAVGLQYYSAIVTDEEAFDAKHLRDATKWVHLRTASEMREHAVVGQIANALKRLSHEKMTDETNGLIEHAVSQKLCDEEAATTSGLLQWAQTIEGMPRIWLQTLVDWIEWQKYEVPIARRFVRNQIDAVAFAATDKVPVESDESGATDAETAQNAEPLKSRETPAKSRPNTTGGFGRKTEKFPLGIRLR
jgi:hypothetical protein